MSRKNVSPESQRMGPRHIYIVDDDPPTLTVLRGYLAGLPDVVVHASADTAGFLGEWLKDEPGVLVLDNVLPDMTGAEFIERYVPNEVDLPILMLSASTSVPLAVAVVKRGVQDVLQKPVTGPALRERVLALLNREEEALPQRLQVRAFRQRLQALTPREREVFTALARGLANKEVAWDFGISPRTVEIHRARIVEKLGAENLVEAARLLGETAER